MPTRQVRKLMQGIAIGRVLERRYDRAAIGSIASLRAAYQSELAVSAAEIETQANEWVARFRQVDANALAKRLRCVACDGPIKDPKRISRRYCSARCRQRARRLWLREQSNTLIGGQGLAVAIRHSRIFHAGEQVAEVTVGSVQPFGRPSGHTRAAVNRR
jgi:hypothetical protein